MNGIRLGYQLYSAREAAQKDLKGTLTGLRALGYDCVELAGLYGHTPEEFRALLDEAGLEAISAHVSLDAIIDDPFAVLSDYRKLGCRYLAIPYIGEIYRPGGEKFAAFLSTAVRFGLLCRDAGIQLLYHNHAFEFERFGEDYLLDFIFEAVPAGILDTELDTCWIQYSGERPEDYVRRYAHRVPLVHIKDFVGGKSGGFEFMPVGEGDLRLKEVLEAGVESGTRCFIVEDEQTKLPPLEAAKISIDALRALGL